jgi:hypothetical protein
MTRMSLSGYGLCRTPDGRTIPCNQPPANGLAQLAMMLHGSGWLGRDYAGNGNAVTDTYQSPSANTSRPAYENSWAAMPDNVGPFDPGSHLPITKAQEIILPSMAEPWIETFPMYEPRPAWEFPPMPDEIGPVPFIGPNRLDGDEKGYNRPAPSKKECDQQWADAARTCNEEEGQLRARGSRRKFDLAGCMRGYVSADCGGNPVQSGKWKGLQA